MSFSLVGGNVCHIGLKKTERCFNGRRCIAFSEYKNENIVVGKSNRKVKVVYGCLVKDAAMIWNSTAETILKHRFGQINAWVEVVKINP